eukprot:8518302-Ditylum_brightwellii.AAC.1
MPKLKKASSAIAFKQKYPYRKWAFPSSHYRATKRSSFMQTEGKMIEICIPSNTAYTQHLYDLMCFLPEKLWEEAVNIIKKALLLNVNKVFNIYCVFHRCEDARKENKHYNGERNTFARAGRRLLESHGIEGQTIADVLQNSGNVCGAAEV